MLHGHAEIVTGDIADPKTAERLIDAAVDAFGRLDVVVSNAGWAPCTPIEKHTPEMIRGAFEINALGPAYLMVAAWKQFQAQSALDHAAGKTVSGGCIVFVSSLATIDPFPGLFAYAGAKSALNSFARSARAEAKDLGIRCFVVAPGAVETAMLRGVIDADLLPTSRTLSPESVAVVIAECVAGLRDEQAWETIMVPSPSGPG
jgi:NAD(P)-dependent dehydrogenase (short-subunit alcohol dehydrogenase family)